MCKNERILLDQHWFVLVNLAVPALDVLFKQDGLAYEQQELA